MKWRCYRETCLNFRATIPYRTASPLSASPYLTQRCWCFATGPSGAVTSPPFSRCRRVPAPAAVAAPAASSCLLAATLGATSKITASIDATTRLLDDPPMGRRREPRHPLGRGEREDRDRLKKQLKKAREERRRRNTGRTKHGDSGGGSGVLEGLQDILSDENDDASNGDHESASVDTRAEAGGMGLLLVPLTPDGEPAERVPPTVSGPTVCACPQGFFGMKHCLSCRSRVFRLGELFGFCPTVTYLYDRLCPLAGMVSGQNHGGPCPFFSPCERGVRPFGAKRCVV